MKGIKKWSKENERNKENEKDNRRNERRKNTEGEENWEKEREEEKELETNRTKEQNDKKADEDGKIGKKVEGKKVEKHEAGMLLFLGKLRNSLLLSLCGAMFLFTCFTFVRIQTTPTLFVQRSISEFFLSISFFFYSKKEKDTHEEKKGWKIKGRKWKERDSQ